MAGTRVAVTGFRELPARHEVPTSFHVPGVSALSHPGDVRRLAAEGHEVGTHGWGHETVSLLVEADEGGLVLRRSETLERLARRRPAGFHTSAWDPSPATLRTLVEAGLHHGSS